jgi:hypothetical protein
MPRTPPACLAGAAKPGTTGTVRVRLIAQSRMGSRGLLQPVSASLRRIAIGKAGRCRTRGGMKWRATADEDGHYSLAVAL